MGQEMSKCKTSTRRGQPNPVYKETFVFQVALFQLSDVTLILSVYNKRSMKRKEMIGWISLGLNSSGEEELRHWTAMKESKGQQVCRWHALLESWARSCCLESPRQHPATMLHTFERTISAELRERALSLAELCEKPRNLSVVSLSPPEIEEHAFDLNFILFSEKARNFVVIVGF